MSKLKGWVIECDRGYLYNSYRNPHWCENAKDATLFEDEIKANSALQSAHILLWERRQCKITEVEL